MLVYNIMTETNLFDKTGGKKKTVAKKSTTLKKKIPKKTSTKKTKTVNPWLVHVKDTMKKNPDKKFKDILKLAKKTYKK